MLILSVFLSGRHPAVIPAALSFTILYSMSGIGYKNFPRISGYRNFIAAAY